MGGKESMSKKKNEKETKRDNSNKNFEAKVVIIGSNCVGKTYLLQQFKGKDKFK